MIESPNPEESYWCGQLDSASDHSKWIEQYAHETWVSYNLIENNKKKLVKKKVFWECFGSKGRWISLSQQIKYCCSRARNPQWLKYQSQVPLSKQRASMCSKHCHCKATVTFHMYHIYEKKNSKCNQNTITIIQSNFPCSHEQNTMIYQFCKCMYIHTYEVCWMLIFVLFD